MATHHDNARMTIDMPSEIHKKLKAMAAFEGVSLKDLVLSCLKDYLLAEKNPNKETLQAFKETDAGENLIQCDDFNDFAKKLGY